MIYMRQYVVIMFIFLLSNPYSMSYFDVTHDTEVPRSPQLSTLSDNSSNTTNNLPKLAFVKPIFTTSAYNGFYDFFNYKNNNAKESFNQVIDNNWSQSNDDYYLFQSFNNTYGKYFDISIVTDIDVHNGMLISENGRPNYSVVLFFHNEYITTRYYDNVMNYISIGGNAIFLDGNAFFGEISYDASANMIHLVSGHGFDFDGRVGRVSPSYYRFWNSVDNYENGKYLGSRYCKLDHGYQVTGTVTSNNNSHPIALALKKLNITKINDYKTYEENCVTDPNIHEIINWQTDIFQPNRGIKMYERFPMGPLGGSLIHLGIYSSILYQDNNIIHLIFETLKYLTSRIDYPWIRFPQNGGVYRNAGFLSLTSSYPYRVKLDGNYNNLVKNGSSLNYLENGKHNLTVEFLVNSTVVNKSIAFSIDRIKPQILFNGKPEFSLPSNFPENIINVCINDQNPEFFRFRDLTTNYIGTQKGFYGYSPTYGMPCYKIRKDFDTNRMIRFEAIDSAGNFDVAWLHVNWTGNATVMKEIQPKFSYVNSSYGKISFVRQPDNLTVYAQVSTNNGKNWTTYPMVYDNNNSSEIYSFVPFSPQFLYDVKIVSGLENRTVYSVKNVSWGSDIFNLEFNFGKTINSGENHTILIHSNNNSSVNATVILKNQNGVKILVDHNQNSGKIDVQFPNFDANYLLIVELGQHNLRYPLQYKILVDFHSVTSITQNQTITNTTTVTIVYNQTIEITVQKTITQKSILQSLLPTVLLELIAISLVIKKFKKTKD